MSDNPEQDFLHVYTISMYRKWGIIMRQVFYFKATSKALTLLKFVAFFHVASLLSTGIDKEKALELDNRIIFSYFSLISM